jgi:hypothetical protein
LLLWVARLLVMRLWVVRLLLVLVLLASLLVLVLVPVLVALHLRLLLRPLWVTPPPAAQSCCLQLQWTWWLHSPCCQ